MDLQSFVLAATTSDLSEEPVAREHADAVEFRMDLAEEPLAALDDYDGELPIVVTHRPEWMTVGNADPDERLDEMCVAVEHDAVGVVDVELPTVAEGDGQRVVDHAREHDTTVMVSSHDFEQTPDREAMRRLLDRTCELGDVGKLAVMADSPDDVLELLELTRTFTDRGERVVSIAMGEAGAFSRAVAALYGSKLGFAPVEPENATAPGQYDLATLRRLVADVTPDGEV